MIALSFQEQQQLAHYAALLDRLVQREGAYSNNPDDAGGETMYGITVAVARKCGYLGPMRDMKREEAKAIYLREYILQPRFGDVHAMNAEIGEELIDTGVNMGQPIASMFLQRALNAFNNRGKHYPDMRVDGVVGERTLAALKSYLKLRGDDGMHVMLQALNSQQGERYIDLSEKRQQNEEFTFGWFLTRVSIAE